MPMTKRKKDKKANAVAKMARKTIGLVARVGDALEAAAAAATPPTPAPSPAPPHAAILAPVPTTPPPLPASPLDAPAQERIAKEEPSAPVAVEVPVPIKSQAIEDDARALAAVDAYARVHNLGAIDMPSRPAMVAAIAEGMARHGAKFTDAEVRSLIDEQMRIHFRTLGARMGTA